jgi:hypothetical protein
LENIFIGKRPSLFCLIIFDEVKSYVALTPGCQGSEVSELGQISQGCHSVTFSLSLSEEKGQFSNTLAVMIS